MKFLSAGVVGVAALALQASAAPVRVDIWVGSPITPISLEEARKYTDADIRIPLLGPAYGAPSDARQGQALRHPTVGTVQVSDQKAAHWVYRPAAGDKGTVVYAEGSIQAAEHDEAFRHWVMTHPDVQHNDGHLRLKTQPVDGVRGKQGGCHKSWRQSFNRLSNSLREALGFAPIVPYHGQPPRAHHIMEMDVPMYPLEVAGHEGPAMRKPDGRWPMPFHHQGQGRHHRFHHHRGGDWHKKPFSRRIMHALYILGPVEGRIVAFVLGLGIGALIRVIFVMCLLSYRALTGRDRRIMLTDDAEESEPIVVERIYEIKEKDQAPAYTAVVSEGEHTLAPPS